MMSEIPQFVSFEGGDAAGKGTQIAWLAKWLKARGHQVVLTREPGGCDLAEKLRGLLLNESMTPDVELMLMFAARRQHLEEVIEPALAEGKIVLCDRFVDSSYAYQGGGRGIPFDRIRALDNWCGGARPQLTLFFDVPVEVARARMTGTRVLDRFEQEGQALDSRVRQAYHQLAKENPERIWIINGDRPVGEIQSDLEVLLNGLTRKKERTWHCGA